MPNTTMAEDNAAGLAPAPEATYKSYQNYFAQPDHDPFKGNYSKVLAPYQIPLANQDVPTPATVQTLSFNCANQNIPTAFLLQHNDRLLHIYLQLAKFHRRMGLPAMQWDKQMHCQSRDLYRNQAQFATWNSAYFCQVNAAIRVPTRDTINTLYAGDNDAVFLGPFGDNAAGTEVIWIRRTTGVRWDVFGMATLSMPSLGDSYPPHLLARMASTLHRFG